MKSIKKKEKKLTLVDKWRNTAALLKQSLTDTQVKVEYWKGRYDTLNEKFDEIKSEYQQLIRSVEGQTIPLAKENQWLRETIELITIPADKLKRLEEVRKERINREDPLNNPFYHGR